MASQSTVEGQTDPTLEPVLSGQEGNKTPGNLDPRIWPIQDTAERIESIGMVAPIRPSQNVPRPTKPVALPADAQTSAALIFPNFGVHGVLRQAVRISLNTRQEA